MLHVAFFYTPPPPPPPPVACFMPIIGSCCAKFETGQPFSYAQTDATTPNVAYVCTGLKATLSFLSYQNFSPSHNFEQHRKPVCTNHCMASKQSTKTTFSNSANLQQKETKMLTSVLIVGGKVRCKKWAKLKETPNCLVTVRLMCFTNGHTIVIFATDQTLLQNYTHSWFSGGCYRHWNYALARYCLVVTQAYYCSVFHMPKYPTANDQLLNQPSLN